MSPSNDPAKPINLPLLCFNDVYRVTQRYVPQPGAPPFDLAAASKAAGEAPKITVAQFGRLVEDLRSGWAVRPKGKDEEEDQRPNKIPGQQEQAPLQQDTRTIEAPREKREGLLLFAGDVFNPSVESSVTRGSHMVPVLNMLGIDVACIGNHDFDFGYPHLTKLLASTNFPWLLSNIIDTDTGVPPVPLRRYWVTERCGVKIGVVGLVEEDWIGTIPAWPANFKYQPMDQVAMQLSQELRDPKGEAVDLIIALTHCRVNNDIDLCNKIGAVADANGHTKHGVDLLVGGHDHMYYIGKGAKSWQGFTGAGTSGTSADTACHLIKSGTDFRDLSSCTLTLSSHPSSVRRRLISSIEGEHHYVLPSNASSPEYEELIDGLMATVGKELGKPVAYTLAEFDALSENVRTKETGLGNWVADVLRHAYAESGVDDAGATPGGTDQKVAKDNADADDGMQTPTARAFLIDTTNGKKSRSDVPPRADGGADAVIICGGGLRGDSKYGPGKVTMGDILEILPYDDPIVCIELDGKGIRDTLEHAVSKWPAQEGRFPIVSGIAVEWDHSAPPCQRIKSIHFTSDEDDDEGDDDFDPLDLVDFVEQRDGSGTRVEVKQRKVTKGRELEDDRVYRVITRDYMAGGGDGFAMLKGRKFIVDDENGQPASSILRSFLLGSSFIFRHQELMDAHSQHLSKRTTQVLGRARDRDARAAARGGAYSPSPSSSLSASPQMNHSPLHPLGPHVAFNLGSPASAIGHGQGPSFSPGAASISSNYSDASSQGMFGGMSMNGSMISANGGGGTAMGSNVPWNTLRRHVVKHDRNSIRDALLIGRTEHMSAVDTCAGDELRSYTPRKPKPLASATSISKDGLNDLSVPMPALHKLSVQPSASAPRKPPLPLHAALEPKAPVPGTGSRQAGDVASSPPPAESALGGDGNPVSAQEQAQGQGQVQGQAPKSQLAEEMEKVKRDAEEDERKQRQGVLMRDDLKTLGAELAIICPLVDGRMRDLAAE